MSGSTRAATLALALALVASASSARADAADAADAGGATDALALEVTTTAKRVAEELASRACDEACRALTSMRRATDRLCALEPGDRCERARRQTEASAQSVQAACPECAVASGPSPKGQVAAVRERPAAESEPISQPVSERTTRGCASCAAAGHEGRSDAASSLALAALVVAFLRGRRPRGQRSRRRLS